MNEEKRLLFESLMEQLSDEWASWFDEQRKNVEAQEQLFEKELEERRRSIFYLTEQWTKDTQNKRTSFLRLLQETKKDAETIIGHIRGHSLAHFHQRVASRYATYTHLWLGIAFIAFVCWVLYAFFFFINDWKSHLLIMGLFGVFTTYTMRRSQHFSQIEYYHRAVATILQTVDIYVATLPPRDRQRMKKRLFQQIFSFYHYNETFSPVARKKDK